MTTEEKRIWVAGTEGWLKDLGYEITPQLA
jgi:hypothetical protein